MKGSVKKIEKLFKCCVEMCFKKVQLKRWGEVQQRSCCKKMKFSFFCSRIIGNKFKTELITPLSLAISQSNFVEIVPLVISEIFVSSKVCTVNIIIIVSSK